MRPVGFFPLVGGVPFLPLHVPVPDCRRTKGEYSVELLGRVGSGWAASSWEAYRQYPLHLQYVTWVMMISVSSGMVL